MAGLTDTSPLPHSWKTRRLELNEGDGGRREFVFFFYLLLVVGWGKIHSREEEEEMENIEHNDGCD